MNYNHAGLLRGGAVLVVSHGNTLRAVVMALEGLLPREVESLEIATGEIVEFRVGSDAAVKRIP